MPVTFSSLNDSDSFNMLFINTHLIIFRFIYGLHNGSLEEVEDLTSETFSRAWKGRNGFSGDKNDALCWLFTIARHLVIDVSRKKKKQDEISTDQIDDITVDSLFSSKQDTPEEQSINRESYLHLWKLLRKLPDERREMLVLRYIVGWQVSQIAEYLEMKENTVSVYIHRSLEQIRNEWIEP